MLCTIFTAAFSTGKYFHLWEDYACAYVNTDECLVLLLDLCATRGIAVCEGKAGNSGTEGKERSFSMVPVLQKTTLKFPDP